MSQTLRTIISQGSPNFGSTPTGADWCVKALHPSDPMTEVRGIPDLSALPSLCMNYQSTYTLQCPAGVGDTWEFDASLVPHPISFMSLKATCGAVTVHEAFLNTQLTGDNHGQKYTNFKGLAQRWRLAYMGVTVIQDGPDLANQGTIVVSQPPVQPRVRPVAVSYDFAESIPSCTQFTAEDQPDFNRSQAMPNAYFNKSKEGAYVPLKLTETCQDWSSEATEISQCDFEPGYPSTTATQAAVIIPFNPGTDTYPFYGLQNAYVLSTVGRHLIAEATSNLLSGNWAHISARNLAKTTSYSFFVRCGIEMQVSPSSTLSPQLRLSPQYDPVALTTYFAICRELKDGYPSDYNTTGKLWAVLKQAYSHLSPALSLVPGGQYLKPVLDAGISAGDILLKRRKKNRRRQRKAQGKPNKKDVARKQRRAVKKLTPDQQAEFESALARMSKT